MFDFEDLDEEEVALAASAGQPVPPVAEAWSSAVYAISDVHIERAANVDWLKDLPEEPEGTLLVAGDLGILLKDMREALQIFKQKYRHVFYCFGNHEAWVANSKADDAAGMGHYENSLEKLRLLKQICQALGVRTGAGLADGVWVVPIVSWYHTSFDEEPDLQPPPGQALLRDPNPPARCASDFDLCRWPGGLENGSEDLAKALDAQNRTWGTDPLPAELKAEAALPPGQRKHPILTFSHFLPRAELLPEKRFLFQPNLSKVVGSRWLRRRVEGLRPDLHVFGHSHFPWDMTLDGIRYRSWPLGTPDEQARRIANYPSAAVENWYPLRVLDGSGRHGDRTEATWFSDMYELIPRDPLSCEMAEYTASIYCPGAPRVRPEIISPNSRGSPKIVSAEEHERRAKYEALAYKSVGQNVKTWSAAQAKKS